MKKLLIGCGITVLVVGVLFIGCGAYFAYQFQKFFGPIKDVHERYAQTNTAYRFAAPSDGQMEPDRFARYMAVRSPLMESEAAGIVNLATGLRALVDSPEDMTMGKLFRSFGMMRDAYVRVGGAHVDLLDEQQMALDEFLWYAATVHATLAEGAENGDAVSQSLVALMTGEAGRSGLSDEELEDTRQNVEWMLDPGSWSTGNAALIAAHREELASPKEALLADLIFVGIHKVADDLTSR